MSVCWERSGVLLLPVSLPLRLPPLQLPPPLRASLMTSRCVRGSSSWPPSWGCWVCASTNTRQSWGGTWCKYNIRGENNHFEVLRMKSVKIILDEDRPIYIPRKENVWHKRLPWTAWVLVNTFQPCDWKPKACDPQQRPRPEIILWEHCVCLQMVLDCFSWMPHFPKARSCFRESLKFGKVLYSKSKVLSSQENA